MACKQTNESHSRCNGLKPTGKFATSRPSTADRAQKCDCPPKAGCRKRCCSGQKYEFLVVLLIITLRRAKNGCRWLRQIGLPGLYASIFDINEYSGWRSETSLDDGPDGATCVLHAVRWAGMAVSQISGLVVHATGITVMVIRVVRYLSCRYSLTFNKSCNRPYGGALSCVRFALEAFCLGVVLWGALVLYWAVFGLPVRTLIAMRSG